MNVPCNSCKECRNCPAKGELHRATVFAFFAGRELPACPFYAPTYFRGVEGVTFCADPAARLAVCA